MDGLEKATMKLRHQVTVGIVDEAMLVMFEQMVGLMEEIKDQYSRIYDSLNILISRKRFSMALASPPDVYRELVTVAAKLKKENMELLMEESQEVFEMDASYILFDNMTLAIFVHLPVGRLGKSMRLYRFIPTPFRFDNRTNLFMMNPNRELLASSESEKERQVERLPWILSGANTYGQLFIVRGGHSGCSTCRNRACLPCFAVTHRL